ncbi:TPA_asm: PolB [Tasmanian devil feces bidnavirus 1]|nr:TPA_asm: PolB [Tasmanian devil feces bidnavirus 1]
MEFVPANQPGYAGPRQPDFDFVLPGYYYTESEEEAYHYIARLCEEYQTITVSAHIGAYFIDQNDPDREFMCHSKANVHIFDVDCINDIPNCNLFMEFENIEGFEKSGLTQNSPTKYYFKCYNINLACVPIIHENDNQDLNVAVARHHVNEQVRQTGKKGGKQRHLLLNKWMRYLPKKPMYEITPATIHEWNMIARQNIKIFNCRAFCIYHRNLDKTTNKVINLYWNAVSKRFVEIKNFQTFFKMKKSFCEECNLFHQRKCPKNITTKVSPHKIIKKPKVSMDYFDYVIYADFECILSNDLYIPSGVCYYLLCKGKVISHEIITGDDVVEKFLDKLEEISHNIFKPDMENFMETEEHSHCKLCSSKEDLRIIMYNEYPTIFCRKCLAWNNRFYIPIVFHNFKGFDSHLLLREIAERRYSHYNLSAKTMEKIDQLVVTNEFIRLRFIDSFNFLSTSLDNLARVIKIRNLTTGNELKAPFPYEWFDSLEKLNETQLPDRDQWKNKLTGKVGNYDQALEIWNKMQFKTFREFHDFYMDLDVKLLADVFEEFRQTVFNSDKIDPLNFQGAPSLTWYLGTYKNMKDFKIIQNKDIYLDIQNNIRGGVCQVVQRYASNDMKDQILYLDVNSLYSWCMTQKMPIEYIETLEVLPSNYDIDPNYLYIISCDLLYPKDLHDRDAEFPLGPEHFAITNKQPKLCCNLFPKKNYLVLSTLLSYYLQRGLILEKVHYVYKFTSGYPLKNYVINNINIRKANLDNKPLADFCKLKNNSIYGKTCENVLKYKNINLVHNIDTTSGIDPLENHNLIDANDFIQLSDSTFMTSTKSTDVILNKPIQIGFAVLEYAKLRMYSFFYTLKNLLGDQVHLLYTDTDSLMLQFNRSIENPWLFLKQECPEWIDFDKTKEIGLLSDECNGEIIEEFIGIRAKTYSYRTENNKEVHKNKGIRGAAKIFGTDKPITFETYAEALFDKQKIYVDQRIIQSKKQIVGIKDQRKLALHLSDDKRFGCADPIFTLPWGYQGTYDGPYDYDYDPYQRSLNITQED